MIRDRKDGYCVEVDSVDPHDWYKLVVDFGDANLYQVWHHGAGTRLSADVSRLVLRKEDEVIAAAETRLYRVPLIQGGIAYSLWGPLYRRSSLDQAVVFQRVLRDMKDEYVGRRGMVLRINPRLVTENNGTLLRTFSEEGFTPVRGARSTKTLIVDLARSTDEIRRDLDKKWRNCLSKAERSALVVTTGTELHLFDEFVTVYRQMVQRKQFSPSADIAKHRRIQQRLPEALKMRVVIAAVDGTPCAGAIYSAMGDTAVYLFGASDALGLRTSASYLVQWHILTTLKSNGVRFYDLNGIDPVTNPGPYHFKRGLAGKRAMEVTFPGQFQATGSSLGNYSLTLMDRVRQSVLTARTRRKASGAAAR
jgi:hypothetical protein